MKFINSQDALNVISSYPAATNQKLMHLRQIIINSATEMGDIPELEETLKWGEPSYLCKQGSTVRINKHRGGVNQVAVYFNCKTRLIETIKEVYGNELCFDGNRAILFNLSDNIPDDPLMQCIKLSLSYHRVKHLPLLGL